MWYHLKFLRFILFLGSLSYVQAELKDVNIITNYTVNLVKTQQAIIFACNRKDLRLISVALMNWNQLVYPVHLNSNYTLSSILTHKNHAKTSVIVDCACDKSSKLLSDASALRYFNKTYQWLIWDAGNIGVDRLLPIELEYLGPNAQVTYVNGSNGNYKLWDVHSKGRHINGPLEVNIIAETRSNDAHLLIHNDIFKLQGIQNRDQFNALTLRGAAVIDLDNITTNEQIETILARPTKDTGVATFVKYHYELLGILRDRFNFTVNFRNARGWAGRLGNSRFRIGFLGIVMRNEVDVGASGAFNRINRFAEFDTIHQSWKFETGFLYRFTPDLDTHGKSGNFLAPFEGQVWFFAVGTLFAVNFIWRMVEWINEQWRFKKNQQQQQQHQPQPNAQNTGRRRQQQQQSESAVSVDDVDGDDDDDNDDSNNIVPSTNDKNFINADNETSLAGISLKTFAAVCQQGMDPLPNSLPSRTIILTIFLFSLVMYNYYTSSVVGGLLSSTAQGPATIAEVVSSPLKLSFEDIGYYKVLFRENKSPIVNQLYKTKVLPSRNAWELPVYTKVDDAIPYLKKGGYAFHCEVIDAYPEIAKLFDAGEICDLRLVSGLLETEVFNWILTKQSQYSEIFRITMCRAREVALVKRILHLRQPKKPPCQGLYRVFPIKWSGVSSAYAMLAGGYISAILVLLIERKIKLSRAPPHDLSEINQQKQENRSPLSTSPLQHKPLTKPSSHRCTFHSEHLSDNCKKVGCQRNQRIKNHYLSQPNIIFDKWFGIIFYSLGTENKTPTVKLLYKTKVLPSRNAWELPVYTKVDNAIPYLKKGGYGFHCEVIDAYPEIAKLFDAGEICDLRLVSGLLETEVIGWVFTKQSQYSEIFRIMMCRAREVALVNRILQLRQPRKPPCQGLYSVFPINWSGVSSAYAILGGGYILCILALLVERKISRKQRLRL